MRNKIRVVKKVIYYDDGLASPRYVVQIRKTFLFIFWTWHTHSTSTADFEHPIYYYWEESAIEVAQHLKAMTETKLGVICEL